MPISRERKEDIVTDLAEMLGKSQAIIIADFRGLPTPEVLALRNKLRGIKSGLHVTKNTLFQLALKQANMPVPQALLDGPTVVAFCYNDIAGTARALNDFYKDKEVKVKGAIMSGSVLSAEDAVALANLPSRDQLLGRLLGTINAPATQVAGVMASGIRQVLYLIKARAEQLEKQGAGA